MEYICFKYAAISSLVVTALVETLFQLQKCHTFLWKGSISDLFFFPLEPA